MGAPERYDWHPADLATMDADVVDMLAMEHAAAEQRNDGREDPAYVCPNCEERYRDVAQRPGVAADFEYELERETVPLTLAADESIDEVWDRDSRPGSGTDDLWSPSYEERQLNFDATDFEELQRTGSYDSLFYRRIGCSSCDEVAYEFIGHGEGEVEQAEHTGQLVMKPVIR